MQIELDRNQVKMLAEAVEMLRLHTLSIGHINKLKELERQLRSALRADAANSAWAEPRNHLYYGSQK